MSAKIATIVGDVHGPPAASPPKKNIAHLAEKIKLAFQ